MENRFQEYSPSALLQPYVDCYWDRAFFGDKNEVSALQRCVPLGTIDIIIQTNEFHCSLLINDKWEKLPKAFVHGIYKDSVAWKAFGPARSFGIRLKPEALLKLFNVPVATLFSNFTCLDTFFGRDMSDVTERIYDAASIGEKIAVAETFLLKQLKNITEQRNYLEEATKLMRHCTGNVSIERLSEQLYVSTRQLQRSFKEQYGVSPKTYMRILRFRKAYEYAMQLDEFSWADVTYHCGYADQAHFIRDFKEFAGSLPQNFITTEAHMFEMSGKPYDVLHVV